MTQPSPESEQPPPKQPPVAPHPSPPSPPGAPYPPSYQYPAPYGPPGPPRPPYRPRHPHAVTVLVLGGLAMPGAFMSGGLGLLAGPFALWLGARSKREIAAEPDRWDGKDLVNAGYVLGVVGTTLLALVLGVLAIALAVHV